MFQTIIQKIVFAITIVLCLGLISCGDTNQPIDNEPIVINSGDDQVIDKPTAIMDGEEIVLEEVPNFDIDTQWGGIKLPDVAIASDLIVFTEVYKVENSKAYLTITEAIHGSTNEKEIQIINTNRFSTNEKHILFLHKNGNSYGFTTHLVNGNWSFITSNIILINPPWVEESCKDDIKSILSAYNNNKELLSNKQALFQLYPQLNSWFVKSDILIDIWKIRSELDEQDLPVLLEWQQRETELNLPTTFVHDFLNCLIYHVRPRGEEE